MIDYKDVNTILCVIFSLASRPAMDIDVELEEVQRELYRAEKEKETLEAVLSRKVDEVATLQQRELTLLQQRSQQQQPAAGSGGGLLVTAVWDNESSSSGADAEVDVTSDVVALYSNNFNYAPTRLCHVI